MNNNRVSTTAFLYISALLGAGFATGKELNFYFFRFGIISGILGILLASVLFGFLGYKTIMITQQANLSGYRNILTLIFGKKSGEIIHITSLAFFIILFSSMSAAFNEIAAATFDMPAHSGSLIFCIYCFFALSNGVKKVSKISNFLCPIMLIGCCLLGVMIVKDKSINLESGINFTFIPSTIIYISYNLLTSTAILCEQGKNMTKKQIFATCAIITVAIFVSGSLCGTATLGCSSPLPILNALTNSFSKIFYLIVLISALITTALGNGLCLADYLPPAVICIFGFLLSMIGFSQIVEKCYFIFGVIGCGVLSGILVYPVKKH